jgi:hypothetical protein
MSRFVKGKRVRPRLYDYLARSADTAELEQCIDDTYVGMAHWAGTGPAGSKCADCSFFIDRTNGAGRCAETQRMSNGRKGARFPEAAWACRHFAARPTVAVQVAPAGDRLDWNWVVKVPVE